ncbi:MAG: ribosome small subunit-dependent GTPase A [Desulfobacterales bacterium]|nr:ribosome small subunit-dependent GTPase A [Desulfobacterales bacterium]
MIEKTDNGFTSLSVLGWDSHFQMHYKTAPDSRVFPAKVVGVHKNYFLIHQGNKEILVRAAGKLTHKKEGLFPVIGDWVLVDGMVISRVLPRKNALSRGAAGTRGKQGLHPNKEQVIAANIDTVFIVSGLDRDFNIRRIERYLTLVYNSGLHPVIILTKADLHREPDRFVHEVEGVAFGVPVHMVSADDPGGLVPLDAYLSQGQTVTMIGSSGAGKSTLVNRLYGKTVQATNAVSGAVGKGQHTTTNRSLILMPRGGMVIDNPGIREIGFWDDGGGLDVAFPEIEERSGMCRFNDCTHTHEPGCRVREGVAAGEIMQDRLDSYLKMKRELAYLSDRREKSADRIEKERWKEVALKVKAMKKRR